MNNPVYCEECSRIIDEEANTCPAYYCPFRDEETSDNAFIHCNYCGKDIHECDCQEGVDYDSLLKDGFA